MEAEMKEMDDKIGKLLSRMMIILIKQSQYKLEKKEQQKHMKRKRTEILKPLTKMTIVNKYFKNKWRPIYEVIYEDYIIPAP